MTKDKRDRAAPTITSSDSNKIEQKQKRLILKEETCMTLWCGILVGILFSGIVLAAIIAMFVLNQGQYKDKSKRGGDVMLRWNATGTIVAGTGSGGVTGNPALGPVGLALDNMKRIYVAEYTGHRISRWVQGAVNGTIVAGSFSGIASNAPSGLNSPGDILLESNGDMYITDRGNSRLQFWSNGASSGTTLAGSGSNTNISLNLPFLLTRNPNTKEIYMASTYTHTIVTYPSGFVFGVTNMSGSTTDRFNGPLALVFDSFTNSLIIANGWAHSLVRWSLGSTNWTLIAGVPGVVGNDSMHLSRPIGLDLDPMGNIYVADCDNSRVQLFMNGQSQGMTIAGGGIGGTIFGRTGAVKLDNQLNLYVTDRDQNRVMMFSRY